MYYRVALLNRVPLGSFFYYEGAVVFWGCNVAPLGFRVQSLRFRAVYITRG